MQPTIHLFVYGTLRKGCANDITRKYNNVRYKGTAVIPGAMYELEGLPYPGVLMDQTEHTITGEVYETEETTLNSLDQFEGYDPGDEKNSYYFRKEITIFLNGAAVTCYVYEINKEKFRLGRIIGSGDWKHFTEHDPSVLKRTENWPVHLKESP